MHINVGDLVGLKKFPSSTGIVLKKNPYNSANHISDHAKKTSEGCSFVYYVFDSNIGTEIGPFYFEELFLK